VTAAELVPHQPADHSAGDCADPGSLAGGLHRSDPGDDSAVVADRRRRRRCDCHLGLSRRAATAASGGTAATPADEPYAFATARVSWALVVWAGCASGLGSGAIALSVGLAVSAGAAAAAGGLVTGLAPASVAATAALSGPRWAANLVGDQYDAPSTLTTITATRPIATSGCSFLGVW